MQYELTIRDACEDDFKPIIELSDAVFGANYITKSKLESLVAANEKLMVLTGENNEVVGFVYGYWDSVNTIIDRLNISKLKNYTKANETIGILKTIVIKQEYRDRGLGKELVNRLMVWFKELQVDNVLGVVWETERPNKLEGLLKALDFRPVFSIKEYWKEDSILNNYECTVCGQPCKCKATFYLKTTN